MFERRRGGDADAEMLRGERDRRRELKRIIDRNLRGLMNRVVV